MNEKKFTLSALGGYLLGGLSMLLGVKLKEKRSKQQRALVKSYRKARRRKVGSYVLGVILGLGAATALVGKKKPVESTEES